MDDLRSNAEVRSEAADWVAQASANLDSDESRKLTFVSPFLDPWTIAVTIGEAVRKELRYRQIAPNPAPRLQCLQVVHAHNLLDWPDPKLSVLRVRPDNLFDPPQRFDMIDSVTESLGSDVSLGDVFKIEGGWAIAVQGLDDLNRQGNRSRSIFRPAACCSTTNRRVNRATNLFPATLFRYAAEVPSNSWNSRVLRNRAGYMSRWKF